MDISWNLWFHIWCLILIQFLTLSQGWLWYTPASREQTIADCRKMKENQSPFYPSYCEELLHSDNHKKNPITSSDPHLYQAGVSAAHNSQGHKHTSPLPQVPLHLMPHINPTAHTKPLITTGWGWSNWGEWTNDACPESCGRRCRGRTRYCFGPFRISCMGHGSEFDNCPGNKGSPYQWNNGGNTSPNLLGNNPQHNHDKPGSSGNGIPNSNSGNNGGSNVLGAGLFGVGGNGILQGGGIGSNGLDDTLLNGDDEIVSYAEMVNGRPLIGTGLSSNGNRRDRRRRVRRPVKKKTLKELKTS